MIKKAFSGSIFGVLGIACAVSMVLGIIENGWESGYYEGVGILVEIIVVWMVTVANDYA